MLQNWLLGNIFSMGVMIKLVLDFKWHGKDVVSLFPDQLKPTAALIVGNVVGVVYCLITGDISLGTINDAAVQTLQQVTAAGGFAVAIDQAVSKWTVAHGLPTPPKP